MNIWTSFQNWYDQRITNRLENLHGPDLPQAHFIHTFIGLERGPVEAIAVAERSFREMDRLIGDTRVCVGVSAQTFWDRKSRAYYHIITTAWQWRAHADGELREALDDCREG